MTGNMHVDAFTFMIISGRVTTKIRNISYEICRKNQNIHFFRKLCHLWDNVKKFGVPYDTNDNIIRRMHFECWISKATHTHKHTFPLQKCFRERVSMLLYTYIVPLYKFYSNRYINWRLGIKRSMGVFITEACTAITWYYGGTCLCRRIYMKELSTLNTIQDTH
jgi:hypothetical protein